VRKQTLLVLGIIWDSHSDDFMFDFSELTKYAKSFTTTKQSLLRVTAKTFDPLGLLFPFVMHLKILFQLMCMNQHAWDDPLPGELHDIGRGFFWSLLQSRKSDNLSAISSSILIPAMCKYSTTQL